MNTHSTMDLADGPHLPMLDRTARTNDGVLRYL
jgi:hypothetical protein